MSHSDFIDGDALVAAIQSRKIPIGIPFHFSKQTSSTNADAMEAASAGAPHGALFLTDHQSQGRGRLGRSWFSEAGKNLLFSTVLRPDVPADRLPAMTLAIGMGIADAVSHFVDPAWVTIKWPNDIWVRSKKVAGILVEGAISGSQCTHIVAGIGLNLGQTQFDPAIQQLATSIAKEVPHPPSRQEALLACLSAMATRIQQWQEANLAPMLEELSRRDAIRGKNIRLGELVGVADGIEVDGRLRLRTENSTTHVIAGELEILDP